MSGYKGRASRGLLAAFLAAECILYLAFLIMDLTGRSAATTGVKYAGVLLCLAFSLWSAVKGGDRLVPPALLLTALADSLLLVADSYYALGVLIFLGAQVVYLIRLWKGTGRSLWPLRIILPLAAFAVLFLLDLGTPLNILALLYFSQLAVNTLAAWMGKGKTWKCFALGLSLFVCCDICVGIWNTQALFPDALCQFARVGMWLFYLPSQVLIALSSLPSRKEAEG